jgi:molybdate transport system regulatory protein
MQFSARNQLAGKVVNIVFGNVMAEVVVELSGGEHVVAMITSQSVKSLKLEVGKSVAAVIKSTDVMIGVPD